MPLRDRLLRVSVRVTGVFIEPAKMNGLSPQAWLTEVQRIHPAATVA